MLFIFLAALMSRSCNVPHCGHSHSLTERSGSSNTYPQSEQVLELGTNRFIPIRFLPYQSDFYSRSRTNSHPPESDMERDSLCFLIIFLAARSSATRVVVWLSHTHWVERLCKKSFCWLVILRVGQLPGNWLSSFSPFQ